MTPPELIPGIAASLGVDPAGVTFLQRSQNSVYEFIDAQGARRIARVTADSHRSRAEILSELEWILFLHRSGLSVCPPLPHSGGDWLRSLSGADGVSHVVVFAKAMGRSLAKTDLTPRLYFLHGQHLGRLHALSRRSPAGTLAGRKPWHEERYFTSDIPVYLNAQAQQAVRHRFRFLRRRLGSLPAAPDDFGPLHLDLGYSNFFLDGDRLEIFDFDNSALGPFVADIAAALYSSVWHWLRCEFRGDRSAFEHPKSGQILEQVWGPFREGYATENAWPGALPEALPVWFQILYLRSVVHAFRMQHPITNPKLQAALDADIAHILAGTLPLRFDFERGRALP